MTAGNVYTCKMLRIDSEGLVMETLGDDPLLIYVKPDLAFPFSEGKTERVFLWLRDAEGRWWGSLKMPFLTLGEVEFLRLASETRVGYFFDWGLEKQLFCPLSHGVGIVKPDMVVPVRLVLDEETGRLMGTMKWKKDTQPAGEDYFRSKEVDILVMEPAELGYTVLVDGFHLGMMYANQTFKPLRTGQKMKAFVNKVREDGKMDILLQRPGYGEIDDASETLYQTLVKAGGKMALGDKSPADLVYEKLQMSKKTFKKALGALYREGRIGLNDHNFWIESNEGD